MIDIISRDEIKIAIVDSGIDLNNSDVMSNVVGGSNFVYSKEINRKILYDFHDENGHGTACATIIKQLCNEPKFYVAKVLDSKLAGSSDMVIQALELLYDSDVKIVNLSLSSNEKRYTEKYSQVCNKLINDGKIIISSISNNKNEVSYPANLNNVIAVNGCSLLDNKQFWFSSKECFQAVASNIPYYVPFINKRYELFGGNSKATAVFTSIIYNLIEKYGELDYKKISCHADRKDWSIFNINKEISLELNNISNCTVDMKQLEIIEHIICTTLKLSKEKRKFLKKYKLYHPQIGLNNKNCYNLISNLEMYFHKLIDYSNISLFSFNSPYTLYNLFIQEGVHK